MRERTLEGGERGVLGERMEHDLDAFLSQTPQGAATMAWIGILCSDDESFHASCAQEIEAGRTPFAGIARTAGLEREHHFVHDSGAWLSTLFIPGIGIAESATSTQVGLFAALPLPVIP